MTKVREAQLSARLLETMTILPSRSGVAGAGSRAMAIGYGLRGERRRKR